MWYTQGRKLEIARLLKEFKKAIEDLPPTPPNKLFNVGDHPSLIALRDDLLLQTATGSPPKDHPDFQFDAAIRSALLASLPGGFTERPQIVNAIGAAQEEIHF